MVIYRTENCLVGWGLEDNSKLYTDAVVPTYRFGLHEVVNAPDPDQDWYPYYGISSGRSRSTILRGRWNLRGGVPDIKIRDTDALGELLALCIGRLEGNTVLEGRSTTDERLNSFTMQIAMRDTDGHYSFIRDYFGGKVNRMSLMAAEGEELRLNLDEIIFRDIAHGVGDGPDRAGLLTTQKEGTPHLMYDPGATFGGRFLFAGATIKVFGVEMARIRRFNLSLDNMLEPRFYLTKQNGTTQSQVVTEIIEGKRRWQLDLELDMADPATDLVLFKYLMNEGASGGTRNGTTGPSVGGVIEARWALTPGEGSGELVMTLGGTPTPVHPGAMVTGGKISVPAPPQGLFPSQWTVDVNTVTIQVP